MHKAILVISEDKIGKSKQKKNIKAKSTKSLDQHQDVTCTTVDESIINASNIKKV